MRWSSQASPAVAEACVVSVPLHLRREGPLGTESLGHLLRDNFYFLVWIAERFGEDPAAWSWVTWPRTHGLHSTLPGIGRRMPKLGMLVSHRKSRRWFEVEASCRNGQNALGPGAIVATCHLWCCNNFLQSPLNSHAITHTTSKPHARRPPDHRSGPATATNWPRVVACRPAAAAGPWTPHKCERCLCTGGN